MMKINSTQADENIGELYPFVFTTSAEELDLGEHEYSIAGVIRVEGTFVNTGLFYRVKGVISCQKAAKCDRCLEDFVEQQTHAFAEKFKKGTETEEPTDMSYFDGEVIDLTELVRDTLLLAQPLNNICSPDCRGLCIRCGANLNHSDCGCDREILDPRLAVLQQFLNKK